LQRHDNAKLGLVFEGGAMRGAVSGGMGAGLEHLNLLRVFDVVYGASSGAFNAVFFVSKQAVYATSVYYEFLNNREFIDLRRFFSRRPIVSLDHVLNHVIIKEKILDWKAVLESPIPLKIVTSSVEKLAPQLLSDFTTKESLFAALHATSIMPLVAGPPLELNGDRFIDASIFEAIPYESAKRDGCTHVLALLSRPRGCLRQRNFSDRMVARGINKIKDGLGSCYLDSIRIYNETVAAIYKGEDSNEVSPYRFPISLPSDYPEIGRAEKRREVILKATKDGMRTAINTFVPEEIKIIETLIPVDCGGHICRPSWQLGDVEKSKGNIQ
jgi:predicted patatin/cPLA2 family phospholipase